MMQKKLKKSFNKAETEFSYKNKNFIRFNGYLKKLLIKIFQ